MKIKKENFLIQVKYRDLSGDIKNISKFFSGFGGELYLSKEEIFNYNPGILNAIKDFLSRENLPLRLHAPITKVDYDQIKDTASDLKGIYEKVIHLCKFLGIQDVVTHAEFNPGIDFPMKEQFENAFLLWNGIFSDLKSNNIKLIIENHYEEDPDYLIRLAKAIDSPYFGLCIDVGHVNAFGKINVREWIQKYPEDILKEVHLADNKGDGDTHLPLGEGSIDFSDTLKNLEKRKDKFVFVLEPKETNDIGKSLFYLKEHSFL